MGRCVRSGTGSSRCLHSRASVSLLTDVSVGYQARLLSPWWWSTRRARNVLPRVRPVLRERGFSRATDQHLPRVETDDGLELVLVYVGVPEFPTRDQISVHGRVG